MSSDLSSRIYTGPWINYSHGVILGSTITLSAKTGNLLVSFLGVFITLVGGQLWKILSFLFHQLRASPGPKDGLHHQHQTVFRNASTPGGASWQFFMLSAAWWKHTSHPASRSLPWAILAFSHLILFGIAGVFSSEVTKSAGKERLVKSSEDTCGLFLGSTTGAPDTMRIINAKYASGTRIAQTYARSCYRGHYDPLQCEIYPAREIPFTTRQNATCPFRDDICAVSNTAAFEMDTGPLESHQILGINARPADRVTIRMRTTCAPLKTEGYTTMIQGKGVIGALPNDNIIKYNYGPITSATTDEITQNHTFEYNTHTYQDKIGYTVDSIFARAAMKRIWEPIPALNLSDSDIVLIILYQNRIMYPSPNDDPIFTTNETRYSTPFEDTGYNITVYTGVQGARPLACAEQYEICAPNKKATNPQHAPDSSPTALLLQAPTIYHALHRRDASVLRAQDTVTHLSQLALPNNQWMIELESWFSVVLALFQRSVVEYALGNINSNIDLNATLASSETVKDMIWRPPGEMYARLCHVQKVMFTDGTISFSVFGLAIIFIVGSVIIFLSLVLEPLVAYVQERFKMGEYARLAWILDEKLQLQRGLFQGLARDDGDGNAGADIRSDGGREWTGELDAVPVTKKYGEKFSGWADRHIPTELQSSKDSDAEGSPKKSAADKNGATEDVLAPPETEALIASTDESEGV
ncbi:hypothetical protein FQN50_004522 [Emmonsiellopsis sp. PD_5]|nr:hypothetical protein FQN50_004522 [Emmonsiellopsis sp. PD_5]